MFLNSRSHILLFIFKCSYTCLYRMEIDKAFYLNKSCTNDIMEIAAISIVHWPVNGSIDYLSLCLSLYETYMYCFSLFFKSWWGNSRRRFGFSFQSVFHQEVSSWDARLLGGVLKLEYETRPRCVAIYLLSVYLLLTSRPQDPGALWLVGYCRSGVLLVGRFVRGSVVQTRWFWMFCFF